MLRRPNLSRHWTFLVALIPLLGWWTYGLFDLDEGFYAAIAAEMNRRGEWITTYYNGKPWFEKPILTYWLLKPSLVLFGEMVGPRVPSILATAGLYALCAWFAKRRLSEGAARWVPIVLGTSLLVVGAGRMVLTDPLLDLAMGGAFLTFWESLVGDRRWRIVAATCLGLGVLAKGPVAGLLFLPVVGWTYWKSPSLRLSFRGEWLSGIVVFALVVASWYLPAYLIHREVFVQKFLIEQNLGRFQGGDVAHKVSFFPFGWAFYILVLAVGFAPWSFRLPAAWRREGDLEGYLKAWALTVFVFFTISGAKLIHYVLPALPALALIVAASLADREPRPKRIAIGIAAMTLVANGAFLAYYYGLAPLHLPGFHAEVHGLARYVRAHAAPDDEVAVFSLPKQEGYKGKKGFRLNETSHPSLLLYLDRTVIDTKEWAKILAQERPVWIITRFNRVRAEEMAQAGGRLHEIEVPPHNLYRLYKLEPR